MRPSCLQTTIASLKSQSSLHTVPHCPWKHTSTRPSSSELFLPPTSRISELLQAAITIVNLVNGLASYNCIITHVRDSELIPSLCCISPCKNQILRYTIRQALVTKIHIKYHRSLLHLHGGWKPQLSSPWSCRSDLWYFICITTFTPNLKLIPTTYQQSVIASWNCR